MYKWVQNITIKDIEAHENHMEPLSIGVGRNRHSYVYQYSGFDIETTQIIRSDSAYAYMYIWSFTFNDLTILGSYWKEFINLLDLFAKYYSLDQKKRMMVFIANMSFEFQFMRKWLNVTDSFFLEERKPLYIIHNDVIEFRDALQITGGKLADLARNYTRTQKMVGDLDYSIPRNHTDGKNLTATELQYVINDTKILSEYMDYYFHQFAEKGYLPLTKTGILRNETKQRAKEACKKSKVRLDNIIGMCHPKEDFYDLQMKWLFRGGYVHGANRYAGELLHLLGGVDETSAYPAMMLLKDNYPVTPFFRDKDLSIDHYHELNEEFCTMAVIDFYDIDSTTNHSLESSSKVIQKDNVHIDNGRIIDGEHIQVFLTNVDFKLYSEFYSWKRMEIKHLWKAKKGRLPRYLIDTLIKYYEAKSKLKKAGKQKTTEYALSKEMVNSAYGLTVTRMRKATIHYDSENDSYYDDHSFVFDKEVSKQHLLPQWGIWITANARYALMHMVYMIEQNAKKHGRECDCVYMDTDSIKILHYNDHKHIIDEYNNNIRNQVKEVCDRFGYNFDNIKGLGEFDLEYSYIKDFRHNGAKRYTLKYYDFKNKEYHTESTIAGLPKGALVNYCNRMHASIWDVFKDGMNIPVQETGKLASIYNDEPHQDIVNGEIMKELSSVCLTPIEFTMSIDANYQLYIDEIERRIRFEI